MRFYLLPGGDGDRVIARTEEGAYDLTSAKDRIRSLESLAAAADIADTSIDDVAGVYLEDAASVDPSNLERDATLPVRPDEVWAAGVTYKISKAARKAESTRPDIYLDVYDDERPELFFKATKSRTVGPGDSVGIRSDSDWNVPEPELGVVLYRGDVVGYTIGNDMSSRELEGENPLYLTQAKVYARCCAIGPCLTTTADIDDPHSLDMSIAIHRDGSCLFEDETSTEKMVRTCGDLISYYKRHNPIAETAVLLTGTSLVPSDDFTLRPDDRISIHVEGIGTLVNSVVEV